MDYKELLPCPFCGSPAKLHILPETNQYYPRCMGLNEGFCLMTRLPDYKNDGFINKNDAISVWNRRVNGL